MAALFATVAAPVARAATQITSSTTPGSTLSQGYYELANNVTLKGGTGKSGLTVAENATVSIYIPKGLTLTLQGANASGTTAGYPGLEIPSSSTVIIVGKGSLSAIGGDGGEAGDGQDGANAQFDFNSSHHLAVGGKGGDGGIGAAGAAAAIGGRGGDGGSSGAGGSEVRKDEKWPDYNGNGGGTGGNGGNGGTMGTLYVLDAISVDASPGDNPVVFGMQGFKGSNIDNHWHGSDGVASYYGVGGGGGGGGGGCVTNNAAAIGGGVPGGGGGGGGGSGGIDNIIWPGSRYGAVGAGGGGGSNDGEDGDPDSYGWSESGNKGKHGGSGGLGGKIGSRGGDGKLYVSQESNVGDRKADGSAETHEFLYRQVTFDFDGGTSRGASNVTFDAYLYLTMPDPPIPDKDGNIFLGYFTGKNGTGTQYYDGTGAPLFDYWNVEADDPVLYAAWRACDPPPHALLVTRLDDEEFDPDESNITFRAALTWAMLFPDLVGEDGTTSKVTFAENLWQGSESATVYLTAGKIRIGEYRFSEHPMIVEGVCHAMCDLVVDASSMGDGILDIGDGNAISIGGLTFTGGLAEDAGGAIKIKGGRLRVTNCVFKANSATTSGGAIYAEACEWLKVEDCHFEGNAASSATAGGGAIFAGGRLSVVNASFWANEATFGGAVWAAETNLIVNSSFFQNSSWQTGGGIYSAGDGDQVSVVNCTFESNIANCQENKDGVAAYAGGGGLFAEGGDAAHMTFVNSFFIGNRNQELARADVDFGWTNMNLTIYASMFGKVNSQIVQREGYNVWTQQTASDFFNTTDRGMDYGTTEKYGIVHDYLSTKDLKGDYGYSIFHDADWDNVALATSATAAKAAILGDANKATILLEEDISARDLTRFSSSSQCGSYWYIHDSPKWGTIVTKIEDVSDYYDGYLTLREIIEGIATEEELWASNRVDGVYTITFDPKLFGLTNVLLAAQYDVYGTVNPSNESGRVNVIVDGGTNNIAIDGSKGGVTYRAFRVLGGSTLTLRNLTIANCVGTTYGVSPMPGWDGGALLNRSTATVERCTFDHCATGPAYENPRGFGGAICNGQDAADAALLTVRDSVFANCRAAQGGAIYNYTSNRTELTGCTIRDNSARPDDASVFHAAGGAAYNGADATLTFSGCTFTNNTIILSGQELPNDIYDKGGASYRTVTCVGQAVTSVALNESALPDETEMAIDVSGAATMPDGTPAVTMQPAGLKPGLNYALGYSDDPGKTFTADDGAWVRADGAGRLGEPLRAPAGDKRGFYRVMVRE